MPVVVLLRTRHTVCVVVPQQAGSIYIMQRERVLDSKLLQGDVTSSKVALYSGFADPDEFSQLSIGNALGT